MFVHLALIHLVLDFIFQITAFKRLKLLCITLHGKKENKALEFPLLYKMNIKLFEIIKALKWNNPF